MNVTTITSESANVDPPRIEAIRRRKNRKPHPARITRERVEKFSARDDRPAGNLVRPERFELPAR